MDATQRVSEIGYFRCCSVEAPRISFRDDDDTRSNINNNKAGFRSVVEHIEV